jgi:hypothetical protein
LFIIASGKAYNPANNGYSTIAKCNSSKISTSQELIEEYKSNKKLEDKINLFCYCQNLISENGLSYLKYHEINGYPICEDWSSSSLKNQTISVLIIIIIPLFNFIIQMVLKSKNLINYRINFFGTK